MAADATLMALLGRLPPGGEPILALSRRDARPDPEERLKGELSRQLGAAAVTLHASGREALRVAFEALARRTGRREIAMPAYTCFSVPAAAVAAGLQVRLVDVTPEGRLDVASLEKQPLEEAAAAVVTNLFGVPEPVAPVRAIAAAAGALVVDDAAQALGAQTPEGPAGGRGDVGVLSFGRGKPLSALGGGALAWRESAPDSARTPAPPPQRGAALLRAAVYDVALLPFVFRALASVPGLGIGETHYDPDFARGPIDGAALCLAAALAPHVERLGRERAARAESLAARLRGETAFVPLVAPEGSTGVHPRLGVVAPGAAERDAAVAALRPLGASPMYPSSLARVPALRPRLAGEAECPGAAAFASRLLTLPTHGRIGPAEVEEIARTLADRS